MRSRAEARKHYIADGGMRAGTTPALVAGAAAGALGIGWLLFRLQIAGWYLLVLAPAIAALLLGVAVAGIVVVMHCRRPRRAALVGALAGLTMYLSQFYFGMLAQLPAGNAHRVDFLPGYILARLKTDVDEPVGKPQPANAPPRQPHIIQNSLRCALELLLCVGFGASVPCLRARRPYVKELGQWMAREEKRLAIGMRTAFVAAFESGTLAEFVHRVRSDKRAQASQSARRYGSCVLNYLRHPRISPLARPVYLTFADSAASFRGVLFGNDPLRLVELEREEVLALRPLFPNLDRILSGFPDETDAATDRNAAPFAPEQTARAVLTGTAEIRDVPRGGAFQTGGFLLAVNLLGLIPLIPFIGGLALMIVGGWGLWRGGHPATAVVCLACGVLAFAASGIYAKSYSGLFEARYARRRLIGILQMRPDAIVDVNDPEAELVNFTCRENWITVKLDVRDDIGLLLIDDRRRELRVEGDKRRYVIPRAAIGECVTECFHHPIDKQLLNQYWYVRLCVRLPGEQHELLLAPSFTDWRPRTNETRRLASEELCRQIAACGD